MFLSNTKSQILPTTKRLKQVVQGYNQQRLFTRMGADNTFSSSFFRDSVANKARDGARFFSNKNTDNFANAEVRYKLDFDKRVNESCFVLTKSIADSLIISLEEKNLAGIMSELNFLYQNLDKKTSQQLSQLIANGTKELLSGEVKNDSTGSLLVESPKVMSNFEKTFELLVKSHGYGEGVEYKKGNFEKMYRASLLKENSVEVTKGAERF